MKKILILIIILGTLVPSIIFCQKNRLSIYTGLFHEYFDGSPMLNINNHSDKSGFLKDRLYNSYGIIYQREINSKSFLSATSNILNREWSYVFSQHLTNVISNRNYISFNINYGRKLPFSEKFNFTYGGGIDYRIGNESIAIWYHYFPTVDGFEMHYLSRRLNDIGLNLRTGLEFTPIKWLTLYTKFNFLGFIFLKDKESIRVLQNGWGFEKYPYRFDLSWRFGIGINFGK